MSRLGIMTIKDSREQLCIMAMFGATNGGHVSYARIPFDAASLAACVCVCVPKNAVSGAMCI